MLQSKKRYSIIKLFLWAVDSSFALIYRNLQIHAKQEQEVNPSASTLVAAIALEKTHSAVMSALVSNMN